MALQQLDRDGDFMPHGPASPGGSMSIGGAVTSGTQGSILFLGPGGVLAQDNAGLFYDDTDDQLVLGAGTVGKPSLIFGDDTSGYWRPAADQLAQSLSGALTAVLGAGTAPTMTLADVDARWSMGRAVIDSRVTDVVHFSHRDMTANNQQALSQTSAGLVRVNGATGQSVALQINGVNRLVVTGTTLAVLGGAGSAVSTGWAAITNPVSRKTFDTTTVTLPQLAEFVGTLSELIKAFGFTSV